MCRLLALCVDGDCARCTGTQQSLGSIGLKVHRASTISSAKRLAKKYYYRLVLIDFLTLGSDIFSFCSGIHTAGVDIVIMVHMHEMRADVEERLFDCGVSDVITSSQMYGPVLAKRVRIRLENSKLVWRSGETVRINGTTIDFARREVWCNGTKRRLPGILGDLLKYFLDNPNRIISREELQESSIWVDSVCTPSKEGGKTFDVNVGKLRKIIESDPSHPRIIESVRGVGWKLLLS